MKRLLTSQVVNEVLVCPYCGYEVSQSQIGCCGESSSHFEIAYITIDGDQYLMSEVDLIDDEAEIVTVTRLTE